LASQFAGAPDPIALTAPGIKPLKRITEDAATSPAAQRQRRCSHRRKADEDADQKVNRLCRAP
jgi:hypothetical protein